MVLLTLLPRTSWEVVERDGIPELVIWRQWLGRAYDIRSIAGGWGRWDRQRREHESDGEGEVPILRQAGHRDKDGRPAQASQPRDQEAMRPLRRVSMPSADSWREPNG